MNRPRGPDAIRQFLDEVSSFPEVRSLMTHLAPGSAQAVHGVGGSVKTLLAAAAHAARPFPSILVCADLEVARRAENDLSTWLGEDSVTILPAREFSPLGALAQSGEVQAQRLWILDALLAENPLLVVAPVEAVLPRN